MSSKGKITEWNDQRGFGFVTPLKGGTRVFVHISSFPSSGRRPGVGAFVNYELQTDERGRPQALNVTYAIERLNEGVSVTQVSAALLMLAFLFMGAVVGAAIMELLSWLVPAVYFIMSVVSYLTYYADKQAAQQKTRRIPEANLIFVGLLGGWPGALIAQQVLRHKNRKASFQSMYWVTVVLNIGLLAALFYATNAST